MREKVEEHARINSDLQNLINSTEIGTIFLDRALQIKRYTPRVQQLFNVTPADIGRPLEHFTHRLDYGASAQAAQPVLRTLQTCGREVHSSDGRWYIARLLPYRTLEDKIDGVVINFLDVTDHRHAEELRREAAVLRERTQILSLAPVFIREMNGRITLWNFNCEQLFGYSKDEAMGQVSHELLRTTFPQPLQEINRQLLATGSWDGELECVTRSGSHITVASRWIVYRNRGRRTFGHS